MKSDTNPWGRWYEVGDRVFVRRNRTLDVNAGLILGDERCLVVDTRGSEREGQELRRAIRSITPLPHLVALTHSHFDHCYGTSVFADAQPDCEIWAHERCYADLAGSGVRQRAEISTWLRESGEEVLADEVDAVRLTLPNHTMTADVTLDLGAGRWCCTIPAAGTPTTIWWSRCRTPTSRSWATWPSRGRRRRSTTPSRWSGRTP